MSIRVYRYGLLPPTAEAERVRDQLRKAHAYRNTLIEIERGRRAALRAIDTSHAEVEALRSAAQVARETEDAAVQELRRLRAKHRSRAETATQTEAVRAARAARKAAVQVFAQRRKEVREDAAMASARDEVNARAAELHRSARAHCGVYWGTYLLVEDAIQASAKAPLYDGDEPSDPRFARWGGEGAIGVQLQGGAAVSDVMGGEDTRMQIAAPDPRAWLSPIRGERRRFSRTALKLRVGSSGTEPIWAEWPMIMHRSMPEGARLKRAKVVLRRIGPREEWSLHVTVDCPNDGPRRCGEGAVAIDLGWRTLPQGVRVAAWCGTDGATGEFVLPADSGVLGGLGKVRDLRSIRDKNFEAARAKFKAWLDSQPSVPEWLAAATKTLAQWRSIARLSQLAVRWRELRFDGDAEAFDALETWRYHDHHLWQWETSQGVSSLRRRRDEYRVFAAGLAKRYRTVVFEDFDLRKMAKRPTTAATDDTPQNETARRHLHAVAPGDLRMVISQAFVARGGEVVDVPAQDTTRTCHQCGLVEIWDQASYVCHACSGCGLIWDQDANASANILERWRSSLESASARVAEVPKKESRWERAARGASERKARAGKRSQIGT